MKKECMKVALYFYNEMTTAERTAFEAHLSQCPQCQKELLFLKKTQEALVPAAAPQDLVEKVLQKTKPVPFWHKMFKPALAFATISAVGVCWFVNGSHPSYQTTNYTVDWVACISMKTDAQYNDFIEDFEVFESEF